MAGSAARNQPGPPAPPAGYGVAVALTVTGARLPALAASVFGPADGPSVHLAFTSPNAFVSADWGVITPAPPVI
jgi:hypothetical protein